MAARSQWPSGPSCRLGLNCDRDTALLRPEGRASFEDQVEKRCKTDFNCSTNTVRRTLWGCPRDRPLRKAVGEERVPTAMGTPLPRKTPSPGSFAGVRREKGHQRDCPAAWEWQGLDVPPRKRWGDSAHHNLIANFPPKERFCSSSRVTPRGSERLRGALPTGRERGRHLPRCELATLGTNGETFTDKHTLSVSAKET